LNTELTWSSSCTVGCVASGGWRRNHLVFSA